MEKRLEATVTNWLDGKAAFPLPDRFAPPSKFVAKDIIGDVPGSRIGTFPVPASDPQADSSVIAQVPKTIFCMLGLPRALKRQLLKCISIQFLSWQRREQCGSGQQ